MSTLKMYVSIHCYSFTLLMLAYTLLSGVELVHAPGPTEILILFSMTACIGAAIVLMDRFPIQGALLTVALRLAVIACIVFGIGGLSGMIPFEGREIGVTSGIIVVVYAGVTGLLMLRDQVDANAINRKLSAMNRNRDREGGVTDGEHH